MKKYVYYCAILNLFQNMKIITYIIICLAIVACSNGNTDTNVKKNENPIQAHVEVDTLPPALDTLMFSKVALDCFFDLGKSTGGEFYYKTAVESVHETIISVIEDHGENGSDIIFLIDKTGSMQNDIDSMRINLNLIIDQLEELKDIRLGVAAYGDKNVDGPDWYGNSAISDNYQTTRSFINKLRVSDGGDYPESVYDGLAKVITETKWRKNSKKIILVIGDAPSLEGDLSDNDRQEIIDLCTKNGVKANLFPVLVTPYKAQDFVNFSDEYENIISSVAPNPASHFITIKMNKTDNYIAVLMDMTGRAMISEEFSGDETKLDVSDDVPNGQYVLRVMRKKDMNFNAKNIVIKH